MSWKSVDLGDHVDILSGFAFKSSLFKGDGDIPIIRIRDVDAGVSSTYYKGEYDPRYIVDNGDLLISMDGEFRVRRWAGGKALLNQRVCKIKSNDDTRLDENYLNHFLPAQLKLIEDQTPFVTVKHLSAKTIREIKLPLPPLEEQKRIAAILDKADTVRKKRQQALNMLDEFLRATFLAFMEEQKEELFEYKFEELALPDKNSFVNGPFGSNLLTSELTNEGVPVVYIRDIKHGRYERLSTNCVTENKAQELASCNVKGGDVLIAKVGDPPGTAAVYPFTEPEAIVTQDVIRMRLDPSVANRNFLVQYLNSGVGKHSLKSITVEATRSRIGLTALKKSPIKIPQISVQDRYCEIARQVFHTRENALTSQVDFENLFSSLSQRAFLGEL
ncbi:restriction endonuclease subunit S [Emcibacter nanhaiensis]|uniref:restriction endonuclease subunit S n=1 Tax=Emcibacter nanhaiensis TaxID=1505037 RepID=UPI0015E3971F|nr:restriction endonuclease subunit S [Emcibacter nanhaiensis]